MAEVTTEMVKKLRTATGAGMVDCKKALIESGGDEGKAVTYLREKGLASAQKKSGRIASEGAVEAYIHGNGRIGVLVEVNIETDFAAKSDEFKKFARDVAIQIAATNPTYVSREEVPADVAENERSILRNVAVASGKPEKVVEKIVDGGMEKFYKTVCLLDHEYFREEGKTVAQLLSEKVAAIGENISIRRFVRFEKGQGLEKKEENFADEVMKQIK
ncbi:MAG: translation elongation factor Ts [Oscillospiraceae bacterium]|nr:translation elongation factor Ts [Oscillospiraceae bacterium]